MATELRLASGSMISSSETFVDATSLTGRSLEDGMVLKLLEVKGDTETVVQGSSLRRWIGRRDGERWFCSSLESVFIQQ